MSGFQTFPGVNLLPGTYAEFESQENEFTAGRWENRDVIGGVILSSTTDSGHTSYTSVLRAGVLMGKVTASDQLTVWSPTATNGSEDIFGILKTGVQMNVGSTAQTRFGGHIISGGYVDPNFIIRSASTSTGIVGDTYEFHIRKLMRAQGFKFTDALWEVPYNTVRKYVAKTADYTVTNADRNVKFTNSGASGTVVFTLPSTAALGLEYWFGVVADQTVTVTAGTADTLIAYNDVAADSISFGTSSEKVGGMVHIYGDGSKWVAELSLGFESQTVTIVT